MASTFTNNVGLEKIGSGEKSGSWGTTTNINFDIIDSGLNGQVTKTTSATGSGSPLTLDLTKVSAAEDEDGNNLFIEIDSGSDLGADSYVTLETNSMKKICYIKNSLAGSRNLYVFQGTYNSSNDYVLANGKTALLKFDGGGTGATVTDVLANEQRVGSLSIDNISLDGNTVSVTDSNGSLTLSPAGTGDVVVGTGSAEAEITSSGAHDLKLTTNAGTNSGNITITDNSNGAITVAPNGTGKVILANATGTSCKTTVVASMATHVESGTGSLALDNYHGYRVIYTGGAAKTMTVPDGTADLVGQTWVIVNAQNTYDITIDPATGNTITIATGSAFSGTANTNITLQQGGVAELVCTAADSYVIFGSGLSYAS